MTIKQCSMALASILLPFALSSTAHALTIAPGSDPAATNLAGVRYRSFAVTSGREILAGKDSLAQTSNRVSKDIVWSKFGANNITFSYDDDFGSYGKLTTTVNNANGNYALSYTFASDYFGGNLLNYLKIFDIERDENSTFSFDNVQLNFGSSVHQLGSFASGPVGQDWMVTDVDLSDGFILTGTLNLNGRFSQVVETSMLEILVGSVPAPEPTFMELNESVVVAQENVRSLALPSATPVPEPSTAFLLGAGLFGMVALFRRKR